MTARTDLRQRRGGIDPYTVNRIEDNEGNVIYDYQQNHSEEQAISFDTATIMNKLLHLPINGTDADAYPTANMVRRDDLDQIGKTGTTEDSNDVWYGRHNRFRVRHLERPRI